MQMLECSDVQERYSGYYEKTLPPEELRLVEEHLADCPLCQTIFKQLSGILSQIHSLPRPRTSADFNEKLLNRIRQGENRTFWSRIYASPVTRIGSYAAAAGLVIALLFTQWMEPVMPGGDSVPGIALTPQGDPEGPVLAEESDTGQTDMNDSLNLQDPAQYIDPNKLQLVNDNR